MQTFFQDFTRDNGQKITVEYGYSPGSETTYSPMYGADGGDGCEVMIVDAMPNTPAYEALCRRALDIKFRSSKPPTPFERLFLLRYLNARMAFAKWRVRPTDAEYERFEAWLAEHHDYEPPDFEDDYR